MLFRLCTILFYKDSANGQIAKFTLTFYNVFCYNQIKSGVPFFSGTPETSLWKLSIVLRC